MIAINAQRWSVLIAQGCWYRRIARLPAENAAGPLDSRDQARFRIARDHHPEALVDRKRSLPESHLSGHRHQRKGRVRDRRGRDTRYWNFHFEISGAAKKLSGVTATTFQWRPSLCNSQCTNSRRRTVGPSGYLLRITRNQSR